MKIEDQQNVVLVVYDTKCNYSIGDIYIHGCISGFRVTLMLQRMDSRSLLMTEKNLSILIIMPVMRSKKRYV